MQQSKAIVLYFHVHQPYRVRHYTIFDAGKHHDYFSAPEGSESDNKQLIRKIATKSYLPANQRLLKLLKQYPDFNFSLSITGTVIEQLEAWAPDALASFKALVDTGRVELLSETYYHSLAFFYSRQEFEAQVEIHKAKLESVFNYTPKVFRNTELAYNNDLASWADTKGYKGILAEGWDKILGLRSPNYVYKPVNSQNLKLLLKNYRLSDDIAFRFGDGNWNEWPLTADKFTHWLKTTDNATNFNLFMDFETLGEHHWLESGIFNFLEDLPKQWFKDPSNTFMTASQAMDSFQPVDTIDMPETVTWADTERDLSAWIGNDMQKQAIDSLYALQYKIMGCGDLDLIEDWRKLQTSDHFYYMCTKWFNDGDIHAYFSPYKTPYEAVINFMNAYRDLEFRLLKKGIEV